MKNEDTDTKAADEQKLMEENEEVDDVLNLPDDTDVISLDEFDEFDKKQDISNPSSSNDGGIYAPEESFDADAPNYEAGTPGHPGIDEGTA